ncbi:MAG: hypothetical protein IH881_04215 [Myxococcales bacterium]|nr:hypothetical protein [Myxococcales bacterium]
MGFSEVSTNSPRLYPVRAWLASLILMLAWGGCSAEPTKSQYVSSVVAVECAEGNGSERRECRIEVIKRFLDVSLEEMKAQYPKPDPPLRPGCSLW